MQRFTLIAVVLIAGVALGTLMAAQEPPAPAAPAAAPDGQVGGEVGAAQPGQPKAEWWHDKASQLIFHAVLQGLYDDGVSQEVVDAVIPLVNTVPTEANPVPVGQRDMSASFIYRCPACHPAFEAFRLYAERQPFFGQKAGHIDHFGDSLPAELRKRLLSKDQQTRLKAVEELIDRWVERRLTLMRLNKKERFEWTARIQALRDEGTKWLKIFQGRAKTDYYARAYADWKSCPTCEGSLGACKVKAPAAVKKDE